MKKIFLKKQLQTITFISTIIVLFALMLWNCAVPNANSKSSGSKHSESEKSTDVINGENELLENMNFASASSSDYIMVYDQENYKGSSKKITASTPKLSSIGWDNKIKSVKTFGNYTAVLFEDTNYYSWSSVKGVNDTWGDGARYVDTNVADPGATLGYMSGKTSSIKILRKGINGNNPGWSKMDAAILSYDSGGGNYTMPPVPDKESKMYWSVDLNIDADHPPVCASRYIKGLWEEFELFWLDNEKTMFALKSKANGKYVCCDYNKPTTHCKARLYADRGDIRLWEMFSILRNDYTGTNFNVSWISSARYRMASSSKPWDSDTFLITDKKPDESQQGQLNQIGIYGYRDKVGMAAWKYIIQDLKPQQNVLLTVHPYTADPSAHVFDGKIYIYCSHDTDNQGGYAMTDYYVYSMDSITSQLRHPYDVGKALGIQSNSWYKSQLWAPDAAKNGSTYYFYFPAKEANGQFRIGVATSSNPYGPFTVESSYIKGPSSSKSYSMDPCIFDDNGTFYLYFGGLWGGQLEKWSVDGKTFDPSIPEQQPSNNISCRPRIAKMSSNMKSFTETPREIIMYDTDGKTQIKANQTDRRFFEGGWMNKVDSTYYFSYSTGDTRNIAYATSTSPYGPFTYKGLIGSASDPWNVDSGYGWTTHHSIVKVGSKWYLFYHDNEYSKHGNEKRSIKFKQITFPPK